MAKQIIVLESNTGDGGFVTVSCLFWLPVASPVPSPTISASQWTGASQADVDALKAGTIVEERRTIPFPSGTTTATIKATLLADYNGRLVWWSAQPSRGQFYGVYYDSVGGWSV